MTSEYVTVQDMVEILNKEGTDTSRAIIKTKDESSDYVTIEDLIELDKKDKKAKMSKVDFDKLQQDAIEAVAALIVAGNRAAFESAKADDVDCGDFSKYGTDGESIGWTTDDLIKEVRQRVIEIQSK